MEHTKHIWRAVLILLVLLVAAVVSRHFLIPESFGEQGFYRADTLHELREQAVVHASAGACAECHADIAETIAASHHATVSCEVCHAPLSYHAANGEKIADMPVNRSHELCALCHQTLDARPATFKQVDIIQHLGDMDVVDPGQEIPAGTCVTCHAVHGE